MNFDLMYDDKKDFVSNIRYKDVPLTYGEVLKLLNKLTTEQIEGDNMKNEEIADEVFECWDLNCVDDDFYDNCMESICEAIGHESGPIPQRAYDIWNIIEKKHL